MHQSKVRVNKRGLQVALNIHVALALELAGSELAATPPYILLVGRTRTNVRGGLPCRRFRHAGEATLSIIAATTQKSKEFAKRLTFLYSITQHILPKS